jgi:hypothetical protein
VDLFLFAEVQGQVLQIPPASQEAKGVRFASQPKDHYGAAPQAEFEAPDLSQLAMSDLPHVPNDASLVSLSKAADRAIKFSRHGEAISGCATRRMPPRLCWRNRSPHLDNFSAPCRFAENASAGAAMAGSDQASAGRRHDISINSISAATARRAKVRNSGLQAPPFV